MELIRGYLYFISIVVQTIVSLLLTWLGNYSKMKPLKMKCPEWVLIQIYKSVFAELGGEERCLLNTEQITHTHTHKRFASSYYCWGSKTEKFLLI